MVLEDNLIGGILAVTLDSNSKNSGTPPKVFLQGLAEEFQSEGVELKFSHKVLDRVVVARLIEEFPASYPQSPFNYLLGAYARVSDELRQVSSKTKNEAEQQQVHTMLMDLKSLIVSYMGLLFEGGVIPQPPAAEQRGALQVLDSIDAISTGKHGVVPMPASFLEEFAAKQDTETLQALFKPIMNKLSQQTVCVSLLGDYSKPLQILRGFVNIKPIAIALVTSPEWSPSVSNGRGFQLNSMLGASFTISALSDPLSLAKPNVGETCFSNFESRNPREVNQSLTSLRAGTSQLSETLHAIVRALLKKETRAGMIRWLGQALETNHARAQMNASPLSVASNGFFNNLSWVLLKLCEPFVEPNNGKAWAHLDADYVMVGEAVQFSQDTKLAMDSDAEAKYKESVKERRGGEGGFHFICECFFMTLKGLHLGVVSTITGITKIMRQIQDLTQAMEQMQAALASATSEAERARAEQSVKRCKQALEMLQQERMCLEAVSFDPELLTATLSFYRLVAAWLLRLVSNGPLQIPLPEPVPDAFKALPEYFVEDMVEMLSITGRASPNILESVQLEEVFSLFIALLGSPSYVKNPYLRSKLTEALHVCLPETATGGPSRSGRFRDTGHLSFIFESHPTILEHLVPSLLQLYVDIEFTGRNLQFYEKFQMRGVIGELLAYLWDIPAHRQAWRVVAAKDGGRGLYLQFCNMLVNDSIYLLDESMKELKNIREIETLMNKRDEWERLTQEERQEREGALRHSGSSVKSVLHWASGCIDSMHYVTKEIQQTFLLPEMLDRVASMLNYFLKYITGPERRKLKVSDPEKFNFRPKELLTRILEIYLHLAGADRDGAFSRAIAADGRSYRDEMFGEAQSVVEQMGLMPPNVLSLLEQLAARVQIAAKEGAEEEELMGDVPEEFLDPILSTLMEDPVILPTSGHTCDRSTITRHLLSDPKDPFSRQELTVDMLLPNTELKQRIAQWKLDQKSGRGSS